MFHYVVHANGMTNYFRCKAEAVRHAAFQGLFGYAEVYQGNFTNCDCVGYTQHGAVYFVAAY